MTWVWIVVAVIVIGAGGYLLYGKVSSLSPISQKIVPAQVAWHIIDRSNPLITNEDFVIFNLGDITSGTYAGDIVAFAIPANPYKTAFLEGRGVMDYYYFIADHSGKLVAWDNAYTNFANTNCKNPGVEYCDFVYALNEKLGLTDARKTNLSSVIPTQFVLTTEFETKTGIKLAVTQRMYELGDYYATKVDETTEGYPILSEMISDELALNKVYHASLPTGLTFRVDPSINVTDDAGHVRRGWTKYSIATSSTYKGGVYSWGWEDCYTDITKQQFVTGLVETAGGIFELDPTKYPKVYDCLYEKTKRYEYNPITKEGRYMPTVPREGFEFTHPMFFWNVYGDYMAFMRSDVVPAAEKAKPVIYLYPETTQHVSVRVDPAGGFTKTDPAYGNGWEVTATPTGTIRNDADGQTYPYLFWEGGAEGVVETPREGFVAARADVSDTIDRALVQYGLNETERRDFLEFWVPRLSTAPYYFITFISRSEIDRVSPMAITPAPQTVIRVLMDYKPLEKPVSVKPLVIPHVERTGFTAVEWGGIVR